MLAIIAEGGPFAILANFIGIAALALNAGRLASAGKVGSTRVVLALSAAALCVGLLGHGVGLHQGANALNSLSLDPTEAARMWRMVMGIAPIPLFCAAFWGALNAFLLCWDRRVKE